MRKVILILLLVLCLITTASAESYDGAAETTWYENLAFCVIISLVIGGISVGVMASGMKSVRHKGSAADYVKEGSLDLRIHYDRYLYHTIIRRPRPRNNNQR